MSLSTVSQAALSGIRASEAMLGVAADNLANFDTPGFKQAQVVLTTRPSVGPSGTQVGTGVQVSTVARDDAQGALLPASGPVDLAVSGDGYFVLEGSDGQHLYTRDGTFRANADGELVSTSGHRVLGLQGDPIAFQGDLTPLFILDPQARTEGQGQGSFADRYQIGSDGVIRTAASSGAAHMLGQVRLAHFNNRDGLQSVGGNLYRATASSGPAQVGNPGAGGLGRLSARHREASNVDIARNLIGMSRAKQLHRANVKVLSVADEMSDELMNLLRR